MRRIECSHCGHHVFPNELDFNGGTIRTRIVDKETHVTMGRHGVQRTDREKFKFSCPNCYRPITLQFKDDFEIHNFPI